MVAGCTAAQAPPPPPRVDDLSLKLKPGMSEQEDTLGQPKSADLGTCGQATPSPWRCKTLHYGPLFHSLLVYLETDSTGTWRVNSWNVF
jgi:hypothetical protein